MKRTFDGKIISLKMNKTAVVEVIKRTPNPLYKKLIKKNKHFKADTGSLDLAVGQKVRIAETRPISKGKFFIVTEVLK